MAAPTTPIEIVNLALAYLGQPPVASISPPTADEPVAVTMALQYDDARQNVLRKYVWNFAKARATLSLATDYTPEFDFTDAYLLPSDFIRLLSVADPAVAASDVSDTSLIRKFDIEGRYVLCNADAAESIHLRYIRDVEEVERWDPLFRKLVVLTLALQSAYLITGNKALMQTLDGLLTREIPDAASIDGQEVPPIRVQRSRLLAGRRTQGSGSVASQYTSLP